MLRRERVSVGEGGHTHAYQEGRRRGQRGDVGVVEVDLERHGAGPDPARRLLGPRRGLVVWGSHCHRRRADLAGYDAGRPVPLPSPRGLGAWGGAGGERDGGRRRGRRARTGCEFGSGSVAGPGPPVREKGGRAGQLRSGPRPGTKLSGSPSGAERRGDIETGNRT